MVGFRRAAVVLAALLPMMLLIGCGGDSDSDGGRIAFERGGPDSPSVFIINADGTNEQMVISDARDPALRRDGQAVAFARGRDIFVVNVNGTGLTNLTNNGIGVAASNPAYHPLATQIAYALTPVTPDPIPNIRIMDADGTDDRLLVAGGDEPAFSPDGNQIVYVNGPDLFLISTLGGPPLQLTFNDSTMEAHSPSFSPLGDQIAYELAPSPSIRLFDLGSRTETVLTENGSQPAFSPFGKPDRLHPERGNLQHQHHRQ